MPVDVYSGKSTVDTVPKGPMAVNEIPDNLLGLDIGPKTLERFADALDHARTIVWNGPVGMFEVPGYERGSKQLALILARMKDEGKTVIVGGGDTAAAIKTFGLMDAMSHVSTGGGASLELLIGNPLPALQSLEV